MAFALAGAPNAVATCGTALADDHFQILKNLARKVVLAYDSDAAGQGAAEKWYGWEQRFEIQLEVADLPAGPRSRRRVARRPASAARGASSAPRRSCSSGSTACSRPPTSPRSKAAPGPARPRAAIVAEHPSELVRDQYVMKLAGELDIDADRLREAVSKAAARPRRTSRRPRAQSNDTGRRSTAPAPRCRRVASTGARLDCCAGRSTSPSWSSTGSSAACSPTRSHARRSSASSASTTSTTRSRRATAQVRDAARTARGGGAGRRRRARDACARG